MILALRAGDLVVLALDFTFGAAAFAFGLEALATLVACTKISVATMSEMFTRLLGRCTLRGGSFLCSWSL